MIRYRVSLFAALILGATARMPAQPAPAPHPATVIRVTPELPEPPVPPEPPVAPEPPTPPEPPVAPEPPSPPEPPDLSFDFDFDLGPELAQVNVDVEAARDAARAAAKEAAQAVKFQTGFFQHGFYGDSNDDRLYESGQRALDRSQWNSALTDFTQVANHGGARADGALYWKAYSLNKLGRRDEAVSAIADLRKSYAKSRWLDDAGALEIEVKQAAGQNVSPDAQPDEELKLLALNALATSDPDRALPLLENLLKSPQPLRLKERALFVLAQNGSPQSQQMLGQMARGTVNPDLQLKAIQYLGQARQQNNGQVLSDVYASAADKDVKRAVINALSNQDRNTKTLVDLARKESDPEMKRDIVRRLSNMKSKEALDYMMELLK
jgi:hypothetical protein